MQVSKFKLLMLLILVTPFSSFGCRERLGCGSRAKQGCLRATRAVLNSVALLCCPIVGGKLLGFSFGGEYSDKSVAQTILATSIGMACRQGGIVCKELEKRFAEPALPT